MAGSVRGRCLSVSLCLPGPRVPRGTRHLASAGHLTMSRWMTERCTEMRGGAGAGAPASTDAIRDSSRAFQVPALPPRATAGGPVGRAAGTGRAPPRGAAAPHTGTRGRPAVHLKQAALQLSKNAAEESRQAESSPMKCSREALKKVSTNCWGGSSRVERGGPRSTSHSARRRDAMRCASSRLPAASGCTC